MEALVHLVAADAAVVKALEIVEHAFDHLAGVVDRREIAWAQTAVNLDQRFVDTVRWVFFERCFDVFHVAIVDVGEELFDFRNFAVAQCAKQCRDRNFTAAIDFYVDRTTGSGLKFEPCTAAWDQFCAVEVLACGTTTLWGEKHTG